MSRRDFEGKNTFLSHKVPNARGGITSSSFMMYRISQIERHAELQLPELELAPV